MTALIGLQKSLDCKGAAGSSSEGISPDTGLIISTADDTCLFSFYGNSVVFQLVGSVEGYLAVKI